MKDSDENNIIELMSASLYVNERVQWFLSKYPDLENPLLKKYPEDKAVLEGDGIFDNMNEFNAHYCYRLAISKVIEDFTKDVMRKIDSNYSSKEDFEFEIDNEFVQNHNEVIKVFLSQIIIKAQFKKEK